MSMPLPGGGTFDQKTVTVTKDDTAVNASIQAEQANGWLVQFIIIDGSDAIILYSQTVVTGLA